MSANYVTVTALGVKNPVVSDQDKVSVLGELIVLRCEGIHLGVAHARLELISILLDAISCVFC